ncbi:unnamed protein product [Durusdinium trenchii]|uniref:Uncharacterized protein n=1 Tax=Durusdinium trenchii TaxID=1381693 RepID=A0ABP0SL48_9DINO
MHVVTTRNHCLVIARVVFCRCYRHIKPQNKSATCSEEVLKLWKIPEGTKLKELLAKEGGMKQVEMRSMIENAWTWAQNRNKLRKNEIHGEEEAKLILDETFGAILETSSEDTDLADEFLIGFEEGENWYDVKGALKRVRVRDPEMASPFKDDWRSPLRDLPTGDSAQYIRIDPAHTYAIDGIGKSFLASGIMILCHAGWFGHGSMDMKLSRAYARFISYCEAYGKTTSITDFSYKTFKLPQNSFNNYPQGLGKGFDSGVVGAWLDAELHQIQPASIDGPMREVVEVLVWASHACDRYWRTIYREGVWLNRSVAQQVVQDGWRFTDGYMTLASLTSKLSLRLFKVRPKLHMMCHLQLDMEDMLATGPEYILNMSVHMCWADEDFVGRCSRISRRTHVLTASTRCIDRALGKYRREWAYHFGAGYL